MFDETIMNDLHSPFPIMIKIGTLTRIKSISITREDRFNQFVHNQEKSNVEQDNYDNDDNDNDIETNDIMSIKPALRQSIHSFQSSDCCSGEVEHPKYPRRQRFNSIDMNDIEGLSDQSITETKESSSSSSLSLIATIMTNYTIDDQIIESIHQHYPQHHPAQFSISCSSSSSYSLIDMEIIIYHENSDDDHDADTSICVIKKQKYDCSPQSPQRTYRKVEY